MQALTARLDAKGRLMPPQRLRSVLGLRPGQAVLLRWSGDVITLQPVTAPLGEDLDGAVPGLIDTKGRISLPSLIRQAMGLNPGTVMLMRLVGAGVEMASAQTLLRRQREARLALEAAAHEPA